MCRMNKFLAVEEDDNTLIIECSSYNNIIETDRDML